MSSLQSGQTILHYRILEKIGQGGMGEVYKAEDTKLHRPVALKILPPETSQEKKAKERLLREARAASALNHPNIVTIYSIEEAEGFTFLVMEYVEGDTLKSVIEKGALETSQLIEIGTQLSEGLAAAHAAGLIHRDIKPSNILVTALGQAKVLDFGLAKLTEVTDRPMSGEQTMSRLTKTGMIVGTVAYMSPEQTRGETLDARTDIFSLGCVLYEAATGKVPFSGPSVLSVLHEIATADPPPPSTISEKVPQGLDSIIQRALAKDKNDRYASAGELAHALRGLTFANRYQILRELGRGGMGVVYLAQDPLLEREVAIKVMSPDLLSQEAAERFKREARVIAKMDHPAIVGIHDIGENDHSLFLVMPYVEGTNLRVWLKEESLSLGDVIDIGIQVAEALEYSHSKNVVHRDIKPENILAERQGSTGAIRVRVTDFGLAMATTESRITRTGSVVGTMSYLSPEQLSSKSIDHRSDLYSLGVVLYECLVGHPPFTGEIQSVLYRIAHDRPDSPRSLGAEIHEELEDIILQCLEKDPLKRPEGAQEVAEALIRHRSKLREAEKGQKLSVIHRASTVMQQPAASPFIGREKEFSELQKRLSAAANQGECQVVLVAGEAGIGKGRLLEELENIAGARKVRVLHSRFVEQDQASPYQGFCEVIQEYFHQKVSPVSSSGPVDFSDLAPDLVSLFPVLAEMNEITGGQRLNVDVESKRIQDRTYIYDLLARSFVRIGGGKPLVLFFEDLQNADVSLDALQYITRRLAPTPTMIVGTYRTTEVDKHHPLTRMVSSFQGDRKFLHLELQPFTRSEHLSFMEVLIGSSNLEDKFVDQIYTATEGNPHFTKELIRSLFDSDRIVKTETGSWNLSGETTISSELLPPTIQQTVEKRIEQLPEERREVLSIASVIGRSFDFKDLETLADGEKHLEDIIDKLILAGFLEEDRAARGDQLLFSSGIVRDVLYAQVPRRRRRSLHRKYAEILEKRNAGRLDRIHSQLVHHYAEGDVPEKVIEFGLELVRKSLSAFSAEDALRAAKTVLEFVLGEEERDVILEGEVRILIAEAHRMAGNIETALQELESAVRTFERGNDPKRVLEAIVQAAETAWERLRADETKQWVERGIRLTRESGNSEVLAKLLSLGATVANLRGEYEKASKYMEEAELAKPAATEREEAVPRGGRLTVALPVSVSEMHPASSTVSEETEILSNIFETLLSMDDQGHVIPSLCQSWKVLEEGKSFQFVLRSNVKTHDGSPLTAGDIKHSFEESIQLSKETLPAAYAAIQGISEFLDGTVDHVAGIAAPSENTLVIQLHEALPIYPALLTDPRSAVTREVCEEQRKGWAGTGPFQFSEFQPNRVLLTRNNEYWTGSTAPLDSIEFLCGIGSAEIAKGIRTRKIDIASNLLPKDLDQILQDTKLGATLVEATKKNIYFVLFNIRAPLVQKQNIRRALCGIVRTGDIARSVLGRFAQPAEGLLPPGILGHDPGRRRTPLTGEQALELLADQELSCPVLLRACVHPILQDQYGSLTTALLKAWKELGVDVRIETPTMPSYQEKATSAEGIDVYIGRWVADYDDPDNFTYALFHSKFGEFRNYFSSEEMDQLIGDARSESNPSAREKIYRKIEMLLMDSGLFLPLFHEIDYRVAGSGVRKLTLRSTPPYVGYSQLGKLDAGATPEIRKEYGGILQIPVWGNLAGLNPPFAGTAVESEVIPNIFESLTREAEGSRVIPWLASEFHAEEGGRRFHFRLRDDVRFHNGKRLTSRDVRYSFEQIFLHKESNSQWLLSTVRGAKDLREGKSRELRGFRIHSALEFSVEMEEPISFFPALLAYNAAAIVPEGLDRFDGSWQDGCVGTGPFRVVRHEPGRRLELEANPRYWRRGYPRSDGLVFLFRVPPQDILSGFRAGRFAVASGLLPRDVEDLRHDPELGRRYRETPQLSTYFLMFNIHHGPFMEEDLRHQLVASLDVEGLVRRTVGRLALPAYGLIPPGLLGHTPYRPKTSKARRPHANDVAVDLMLNSIYEGPYSFLKNEITSALGENGFQIRILPGFHERASIDAAAAAHLVLGRWIADYPDADTFIHGLLHSSSAGTGRLCGTPEMNALIERARTETRPEVRHDIYMEAEDMIARRALLLPLFHEQTYRFARPEVEDFELTFSTLQPVPYEKLWTRR